MGGNRSNVRHNKTSGLGFSYGGAEIERRLFDNLSIDIEAGEFVGLTGPSGSGKSTLLNILGLIEDPRWRYNVWG